MQLVAYGAQDVYLTGNPQITFFKVVYRRHTNFSMESIKQTWNGSEIADGRCTATISRNGDLVHKMWIELRNGNVQSDNTGSISDLIDTVEVEIGGQIIDKQSGAFMQAWNELTQTASIDYEDTKNSTLFHNTVGITGLLDEGSSRFIPLNFWFCKNAGLALPLIALQYHEVKIILNHRLSSSYIDAKVVSNDLWVDYIYLDTDERRRFAQVSHEYLIEQVQEQVLEPKSGDHALHFNHPVKELIWFSTLSSVDVIGPANGGGPTFPAVKHSSLIDASYTLKLNGHERFAARPHSYFSRVQIHQHHSGDGGNNSFFLAAISGTDEANAFDVIEAARYTDIGPIGLICDSICVYSFALNPEEHQPSGTCNFSRIDTAVLNTGSVSIVDKVDANLTIATFSLAGLAITPRIVAINYNVLRIMSGMGGLAYSN